MSGLMMPGGDPAVLEDLASSLEAAAAGFGGLGRSTHQVTVSVRSGAEWTGDAADSYSAFTGNLGQGVAAVEAPLSRIALSVRDYAGFLRTAQQKVTAYASAAETAQVSGNDSAYASVAEGAAQDAEAALTAWQAGGDRVATEVTNAAGQLGNVFGSQGPVQSWLGSQPVPLDTLAGMPGLGNPMIPEILKTPGSELGPEILKTPGGELGSEILITLPGEIGPEILITPPGDLGPGILKTPPGLPGPLINYSEQGSAADVDPHLWRLSEPERGTLPRLQAMFPDRVFRVSPEERDGEYIDDEERTYDQMGDPATSKYWSPRVAQQFFEAIDGHLLKSVDFTVIDLTAFSDQSIADITRYVDSLSEAEQARVIRIGF
jgi:uncharacterized protein YukE